MVKKKRQMVAIFLLLEIFLFSGFILAGGTSFDDSEEASFNDTGSAIIKGMVFEGEEHYHSYSAYKGEDIEYTMIVSSADSSCSCVGAEISTYNEQFKKTDYFDLALGKKREVSSFMASWSGKRYIRVKLAYCRCPLNYEIRIVKKCREGYSDEFRKCEDEKWIQKPIKDFLTEQEISASECNGCIFSGYCYKVGQNFSLLDGTKKYCSFDKQIVSTKTEGKECVESYECTSPLTCTEGKCYDLREVKDKATGDVIYAKDCQTNCIVNNLCYSVGNRFKNENRTESYCSVRKVISPQKEEKDLCNENYECFSNECSKGACIDTVGFIQEIVNWFKSVFGLN